MAKKLRGSKHIKHSAKQRVSKKTSAEQRIPSGIPGLDRLIEGGFISGSSNLVCGGVGAGKTIFCTQFLLEGLNAGENCMFITLEEQPHDIMNDVARFKWDLKKYVDSKKLILEYRDPFQVSDISAALIEKINEHKIKRAVIDSTSILGQYFKDPFDVRKELFKLINGLKNTGVTALLTSEIAEDGHKLSRFGVEEFLTDGVIALRNMGLSGELGRSLHIKKMRRTNHSEDVHTIKIGKDGIKVLEAERGIKF